jgi:integrase
MPRPRKHPRLKKQGQYYYIVGNWNGRDRQVSTRQSSYEAALHALADFIKAEQAAPRAAELDVEACIKLYQEEKGIVYKYGKKPFMHLLRHLGSLPASAVNPAICREYYGKRKAEPFLRDGWKTAKIVKDNTIRRELVDLRSALNYAHKSGRLQHPPLMWLPLEGKPREKFITKSEARRLLPHAASHIRLYILLALGTGARNAAILNLTWDDVVFPKSNASGRIDLRRFDAPRNRKRRGVVPLLGDSALAGALVKQRQQALTNFVVEYAGRPIKSAVTGLQQASKRAEIQRVTPHMLKHTAITWMLEDGVPIADVADFTQTSHKTISETYGHYTLGRGERAASAVQLRLK